MPPRGRYRREIWVLAVDAVVEITTNAAPIQMHSDRVTSPSWRSGRFKVLNGCNRSEPTVNRP